MRLCQGLSLFESMYLQAAQSDRLTRLSAAAAAADVNAYAELADLPVQTGASRTGKNLPRAHRLLLTSELTVT